MIDSLQFNQNVGQPDQEEDAFMDNDGGHDYDNDQDPGSYG